MTNIPLSVINLRTNKETALSTSQVYINKNPPFQREYESWDEKMKTRFIETILIGRAMNPIWTISNPEDNSEDVLDGMHRLTTSLDFLNNKFKLNAKFFTEQKNFDKYDGKIFEELSSEDKTNIRNYNFTFNQLDESYHYDENKKRDQYEILNRSTRTLNEYEFNKVLYSKFFHIISVYKNDLNKIFFGMQDKRGSIETEIIDIIVLSKKIPNSWSSVNDLRNKYYNDTLGNTQESVTKYINENEDKIKNNIIMIKKIINILKDNNFFNNDKKTFKKYFLPYKFIISRILNKFGADISLFNRHHKDIIEMLKEEITEIDIDIQEKLDCTSRNAMFQRKLINLIDVIINKCYEKNNDKRLFNKSDIDKKIIEQNYKCALCNETKEKWEGDHITPWSRGGKTTYENLQVLCVYCNKRKSSN